MNLKTHLRSPKSWKDSHSAVLMALESSNPVVSVWGGGVGDVGSGWVESKSHAPSSSLCMFFLYVIRKFCYFTFKSNNTENMSPIDIPYTTSAIENWWSASPTSFPSMCPRLSRHGHLSSAVGKPVVFVLLMCFSLPFAPLRDRFRLW